MQAVRYVFVSLYEITLRGTVKLSDILKIMHPLVTCVYSVVGYTICSLVNFVPQ
jgi:hypothetical protein